jgi:hypothetical protein
MHVCMQTSGPQCSSTLCICICDHHIRACRVNQCSSLLSQSRTCCTSPTAAAAIVQRLCTNIPAGSINLQH